MVFLHGIGNGPSSWDAQIAALPPGFQGIAPRLRGLRDDEESHFSVRAAAAAVRDELNRRGVNAAHVCGLSLGGMVATRFALEYPERVSSLVLSGSQVRPHPALMLVQRGIFQILPERFVAPEGMSKRGMLRVFRAAGAEDFRAELGQIVVPTLVLCGEQDRPNLSAARQLAREIPAARLRVVPNAGHVWNVAMPQEFSAIVNEFFTQQGAR